MSMKKNHYQVDKLTQKRNAAFDADMRRKGYNELDYGFAPELFMSPKVQKMTRKRDLLAAREHDIQRKAVSNARRKRR